MLEPVLLVWTLLCMAAGIGLNALLKKQGRMKDKHLKYHVLGGVVLSFLLSVTIFYVTRDEAMQGWSGRAFALACGALNAWVMWKRPWSKRHTWDAAEDSVWPEALFGLLAGLAAGMAFVAAPQTVKLVPYSRDLSVEFWDFPVIFLLPFWVVKAFDLAGQIPTPQPPVPLIFTIEEVQPDRWDWVKMIPCTFELHNNLEHENRIFARRSKPWVEVPRARPLHEVFKLMVQERRKRTDLSTLQDFGDEYAGKPEFCWIFWLKAPWYDVPSWFQKRRYVDPMKPLEALGMRPKDVIRARRVPTYVPFVTPKKPVSTPTDPNATVIIKR